MSQSFILTSNFQATVLSHIHCIFISTCAGRWCKCLHLKTTSKIFHIIIGSDQRTQRGLIIISLNINCIFLNLLCKQMFSPPHKFLTHVRCLSVSLLMFPYVFCPCCTVLASSFLKGSLGNLCFQSGSNIQHIRFIVNVHCN